MTTNTNAALVADAQINAIACALAELDGYDPKDQNCGLYDLRWSGGPNPEPEGDAWHMDYLPKAEKIASALTTAAAVPLEGFVMVPKVPDERMERAIAAAFFGTVHEARKAWVAGIAAAPKAEPVQAGEYPPMPQTAIDAMLDYIYEHGTSAEGVKERIESMLRAYVDADRAMRAQAAPQPAVQQGWDIDAAVEKAWGRFQAAMDKDEPLPPPSIHATAHYCTWLGREAHRHDEPKAGAFRNAARMLAVLEAEIRRLHAELIAAQPAAPVAQGDGAEPVAYLWQHSETGRTRVVMPDAVITADASWRVIGPLFLAARSQSKEGA